MPVKRAKFSPRTSVRKRLRVPLEDVGEKHRLLAELEMQRTNVEILRGNIAQLQSELERTRANLISLYDAAPIGYVTLDRKGIVREVNSTAAQLMGRRRKQILDLPFSYSVARADTQPFFDYLNQCKKNSRSASEQRAPVSTEIRLRRPDGSMPPVQLVAMPVHGECYQVAMIHLTGRNESKQAAEEARVFAEGIVQTVREPLVVLNSNLKIVSVNRAFEALFKMRQSLAKDLQFERVLNLWWTGNDLRHGFERALFQNVPLDDFECEVQLRDLGRRIFLFNARHIARDNSPPLLLVALEDITARREAEEKLEHANAQLQDLNKHLERRVEERTKELRQSNKQLESFCYSIAHDLRAPLRSTAGFGMALLEEYAPQLGEQGREYVKRIVGASGTMDQLINDLLEYGRFNTAEFAPKPVDAEEVLSRVISNLDSDIQQKHAHIERKGKLPKVHGHKAVLEAAFSNLLNNAIKFVRPEVSPRVTISAEQHEEQVRIWITDNGIGIDPAYHGKIFEVFQRLHTQNAYPGTGIGLAIVNKGIERIGGRVGVESEPGKGSRFWIDLRKAA
jgi:PAS domain S-box-containing protein